MRRDLEYLPSGLCLTLTLTLTLILNICLQDCEDGGDLKFFLPEAKWSVRHHHEAGVGLAHRGDVPHGSYPVKKGPVTLTLTNTMAL